VSSVIQDEKIAVIVRGSQQIDRLAHEFQLRVSARYEPNIGVETIVLEFLI
jgi:hypothetical protein